MATGVNVIEVGADVAEDEGYDDDNDYEGMDTMLPPNVNHLVLPYNQPSHDGMTGTHSMMQMAVPAPGPAFAPVGALSEGVASGTSGTALPMNTVLGPLSFSSFMSNAPAAGQPPLSAYGQTQASLASLGHSSTGQMPNGGHSPASASSAPLHQRPESGGSG